MATSVGAVSMWAMFRRACVSRYDVSRPLLRKLFTLGPCRHSHSTKADAEDAKERDQQSQMSSREQYLTQEDRKRINMIQLEYDAWVAAGEELPRKIPERKWIRLLKECPTQPMRYRMYKRWKKYEAARDEKKAARFLREESAKSEGTADDTDYFNRILLHTFRSKHLLVDEYRLAYAMQFGQPLVVDMQYNSLDIYPRVLARQVLDLMSANRLSPDPFHLHFCSADSSSDWFKETALLNESQQGRIWPDDFLSTVTPRNLMDVFPRRESLIYLSPRASERMQSFDHNAVYVVGGLTDRETHTPLSLSVAEKLGVRSMRLPLDKYAKWKFGSWSLQISEVVAILNDFKATGDWLFAFENTLPRFDR